MKIFFARVTKGVLYVTPSIIYQYSESYLPGFLDDKNNIKVSVPIINLAWMDFAISIVLNPPGTDITRKTK